MRPGHACSRQCHTDQPDPDTALRRPHKPRRRQRTHQITDVVGGRPFGSGDCVQACIAQHQRHERRESKPPNPHRNGKSDETGDDNRPR